jgi:hypothetical protein
MRQKKRSFIERASSGSNFIKVKGFLIEMIKLFLILLSERFYSEYKLEELIYFILKSVFLARNRPMASKHY